MPQQKLSLVIMHAADSLAAVPTACFTGARGAAKVL